VRYVAERVKSASSSLRGGEVAAKLTAGALGPRAVRAERAGFCYNGPTFAEEAMVELKVERIGDRVAVVLTEDAMRALHVSVGDTLQLTPSGEGCFEAVAREGWAADPHARGRAFLRRYNRGFERFEG